MRFWSSMKATALGEIGRRRPVFDGKALALAHHTARPTGDLGDEVGAEALDDLVEGTGNGLQRGEPLDQLVAAGDGFPALDRLAVTVDRPRRQIALAVGERFIELQPGRNGRDSRGHIRAA